MIDKEQSRQIRTKVRHVLMAEWDPIGVNDEPMAADQYDHYLGDVLELLKRKASSEDIYDYLQWVETHRMGLTDLSGAPLRPRKERQEAVDALRQLLPLFDA